ncbi:MAG: glycosyltransferase [Thioalkalivibrionaceae bacterium]
MSTAFESSPALRPRIADLTMFYALHSGGVRTYLEAKQRYFLSHCGCDHRLYVPGDRLAHFPTRTTVPALLIAPRQRYRFPLRGAVWRRALLDWSPNLIEVGDPYRLGWVGPEVADRLGIPAIAFYHSDLAGLLGRRLGRAVRHLTERYLQSLYARYALVMAPSRAMADKLRALGVDTVEEQPLGVDGQMFHPGRGDVDGWRMRVGAQADARLIVYIGRAAREKNVPWLLEAAKRLGPRVHLVLGGLGMPRAATDNVTVLDRFLPPQETASLLASADALVHAGTEETFALIAIEAQACGTPVIGLPIGAMPERIENGTGRLAEAVSAPALADAIAAHFETAPDLDAAVRWTIRQRILAHHAWDTVFEGLLARYARVLGSAFASQSPPVVESAQAYADRKAGAVD